jgi:hypothetical protein
VVRRRWQIAPPYLVAVGHEEERRESGPERGAVDVGVGRARRVRLAALRAVNFHRVVLRVAVVPQLPVRETPPPPQEKHIPQTHTHTHQTENAHVTSTAAEFRKIQKSTWNSTKIPRKNAARRCVALAFPGPDPQRIENGSLEIQ